MSNANSTSSQAALESARLLRELHAIFCRGEEESKEADLIRDDMERPWYAMTPSEQERMGGLSQDLYALAEGGPPQVPMDERQIQEWRKELDEQRQKYQQGDIDGWLAFWRKPRPRNFPAPEGISTSIVHFFQAHCWDKLKDYETAALFRKAAENLVMEQLTRVA
jgi:hypothetical protein